uniref:EF-hand domain-containing protein n=1 Tax=Chlamydomonas leiostraca TaxID=1034604 RepID=A0A7S0WWR4_9CHLO|mmetsp:Transcript_31372/g.80050  ORF Transcript_31372/g.80050 Transcript_31372/m.80050 type:complete len:201 (+) Transcript_31372:78-680(+)
MASAVLRVQLRSCTPRVTHRSELRPVLHPCVCSAQPSTSSAGPQYPSSELPRLNRPVEPTYYPGIEEEENVSHAAFHNAFEASKPNKMKVAGLQEFAAAIWDRRRRIPSATSDPLLHLFKEFDTDNDGLLTAEEIAKAFSSHGVTITETQVKSLIDEFEEGREHDIKLDEWVDFVYSLAVSDLHAKGTYVPGRSLDSMDG